MQQTNRRADQLFLKVIIVVGLGVLAIMPFYAFLSTWLGTAIGPLVFWKSLKDVVVGLLGLAMLGWLILRPQAAKPVLRQRPIVYALTFVLLALLVTLVQSSVLSQTTQAGILFGLRYIVLFVVLFVAAMHLRTDYDWRRWTIRFVTGLTLVFAVLTLLQVYIVPVDFLQQFGYDKNNTIAPSMLIDDNPAARRAFVTMRGPNDFAAYLLIILGIVVMRLVKKPLQTPLVLLVVMMLFLSASRSAWLGAIGLLATQLVLRYGPGFLRTKKAAGLLLVAGVMAVTLVLASLMVPAVRLAVFHSSPSDSHLTEGSTDDHWKATARGIERVVHQPLGCGLGCAGPATFYGDEARISENYYVQIAEETGIVGLVVWLVLFVSVMLALLRQYRHDAWAGALFISGIAFAIVGVLLHVWADDAVSLTWWGLSGLVLGQHASAAAKKKLS